MFTTFLIEAAARQKLGISRVASAWRLSAWLLFIILALPATAQPIEPDASYTRTYSYVNDVTPNDPQVTVAVAGAVNVFCFTIEETLPAAATAMQVSDGGVYLPDLNVIRWGPYFDTVATTVTYRLAGLPANYPVDGGAWMDGQWYFSPGVTVIPVLPPGSPLTIPTPPPQVAAPVFTPASGGAVPDSGVTITVPNTPGAIIYYTVDGTMPGQNATLYSGPIMDLPLNSASIAVVRAVAHLAGDLPSVATVAYYGPPVVPANATVARSVATGSPAMPVVTFTVTPGLNAKCFTVTESLPPDLGAINVSPGGNYIAANNVVEWGPFLAPFSETALSALSYQAVGLPGMYAVRATWSVDGTNGGEKSATSLVIAPAAVNTIPTPPPQVAAPMFTPTSGGAVPISGVTITVPNTPGAIIYYTVDGTLPGQNTTLYFGPIMDLPLNSAGVAVVRAVARLAGDLPSVATVAYYGPPAVPANATVARSVATGSPAMPLVTFTVTPGLDAKCFTVTESLPPDVGAINVSPGGNYIAANNVVEWGPFLAPFSETALSALSYQAVGLPGTYPVRATWSVDGTNGGEKSATSLVIAPAAVSTIPTPPLQEPKPALTPAFGASLPVTVSISCSDPMAKIYYATDGTLPTQGSTPYTVPLSFSIKTSLRAVAFREGYLPSVAVDGEYVPVVTTEAVSLASGISGNGGLLPTVSLTATPQGVKCYAVVETIPYGLTPSDLSGNGIWDPVASVVRWGPYLDSQGRVFSFDVAGASGIYSLSGQVSFDGYSTTTTGSVQVSEVADTTPPTVTVTSISDGATATSASLLVSGTATDSGKGNDGISYVTVNGVPASNDTATGANTANWSAIVSLHSGVNNIIVIASDTLDNTAQADLTVTYNPPTLMNTSVAGGNGGGQQNLQTTLSGLSVGDVVTLEQSTDLKTWTLFTSPGFVNPITVTTGSTVTLSIPIIPTSSGQYFQVKVQETP